MPANNNFVSRRNAQLLTVPSLPKIPFLFDHMHRHYHHHYKSILIVSVYADPDEVCHMVKELLPVFWVRNKYLSPRGRPLAAATWWALVVRWSHRKSIIPNAPYNWRTRSLEHPLPSLLLHSLHFISPYWDIDIACQLPDATRMTTSNTRSLALFSKNR